MRIRTIKPEFWSDEKIAPLPSLARLVYIGLWNLADDEGRLLGSLRWIDGQLFPLSEESATDALDLLEESGRIIRYRDRNGRELIQIVSERWRRHQKIDRPRRSCYEAPQGYIDEASTNDRANPENNRADVSTGTREHGEQGNKGNEGAGSASAPVPASDSFDRFWDAYPARCPRRDKAQARKAWEKSPPPIDAVLAALAWQDRQPDWLKDGGQFIPAPAVWLNQRRWEREPPAEAARGPSRPLSSLDRLVRRVDEQKAAAKANASAGVITP